MRVLLVVVLALGTVYGGYWVVGSIALQTAVEAWFQQPSAPGLRATNTGVAVQGFPSRFDLTVTKPKLTDAVTGYGWSAPFAQVFSMTWKPWHLIAALPDSQTVTTPGETVSLSSSVMKGSLELVPGTALALDAVVLESRDIAAKSTAGWQVAAKTAQLATRQAGAVPNAHEVNLTVTDVIPDPALMTAMAATSDLPPLIKTAYMNAILKFTAPLDRFAATTRPDLQAVIIDDAALQWGDMRLSLAGTLTADAEGFAEGRIDITLTKWRKILPPLVALGLLKVEIAPTAENMLDMLARQSTDPSVLSLPVSMRSGVMSIGPLPLGPAPRMLAPRMSAPAQG